MKKYSIILFFTMAAVSSHAQELQAKVTVVTTRVANNVNRNVFRTLQTALTNFLNNRKWSSDVFQPNEKIECNFLLNVESTPDANIYNANLIVQAARPVFSTSYLSPIVNFQDEAVNFKYVEFQPIEFNDNRVTGSDPQISNLSAIFAYYAYMILGFDYASFSQHGGDLYFQKAQNLVNNAPDGRGISGWRAFDGVRNRYWLVENMMNSRYNIIHDVYYNYYRLGMDKMYENESEARVEILNVLNLMSNFIGDNPNTMISQFFFQGKSQELVQLFSKAQAQDKTRARELLAKMDLTNANLYKEQLK